MAHRPGQPEADKLKDWKTFVSDLMVEYTADIENKKQKK